MILEINSGRKLRKRGNCSLDLHDSRQLHSCSMLPISAFLICLTLIVVVLLCYWLNVALAAIFAMFHGCPIQRMEVQRRNSINTGCGPKPSTPVRWTPICEERVRLTEKHRGITAYATTFESFRPDEVLA